MSLQIPLIFLSRYYINKKRGNSIVWLGLIISFPIVEIAYIKEYLEKYGENSMFCL